MREKILSPMHLLKAISDLKNYWLLDKNVVVIGGGDTGRDCVGTSNRHGAKSVTQFELLPKPPADRTPFMPWPTYPMVLKTTSSHEEGANDTGRLLPKNLSVMKMEI